MAIGIKSSSKTLSDRFDTCIKSRYKFLSLVHAGTVNGLSTVTKSKDNKHRHSLKRQPILSDNGDLRYEQCYYLDMTDSIIAPYVTMVYPNGANTAGRVVYIGSTRIVHSPLWEFSETSRRTQTTVKVLGIAKQLQQIRSDSNELCPYMAVPTIPNYNGGELDQVVGSMSTRITTVIGALQGGYHNGNGLRLVDHNSRSVRVLGATVKTEITIS